MHSTEMSSAFIGVQMRERQLAEREEKMPDSREREFQLIGDILYST